MPQATNLSQLADSIAAELQQSEPKRMVEFVVAENITANGDPALLRELLVHLLDNAWKFTVNHHKARIEFGSVLQADGTWANFVRDNGTGFKIENFDAFQRFRRRKEFSGIGLGLASIQRIVQRHRGRVWARSVVGEGSTFYFILEGSTSPASKPYSEKLQVAI